MCVWRETDGQQINQPTKCIYHTSTFWIAKAMKSKLSSVNIKQSMKWDHIVLSSTSSRSVE